MMPTETSVIAQAAGLLFRSATASTTSNRDWNTRLVVSIAKRVSLMVALWLDVGYVVVPAVIGPDGCQVFMGRPCLYVKGHLYCL
jgi:hypothetical protein